MALQSRQPLGLLIVSLLLVCTPIIGLLLMALPWTIYSGDWSAVPALITQIPLMGYLMAFGWYGVLGVGVFFRVNKLRWLTITWLIAQAIAFPLGMLIGTIAIRDMLPAVIQRYGIVIPIILPWLTALLISALFLGCAFYLLRPSVRSLFS